MKVKYLKHKETLEIVMFTELFGEEEEEFISLCLSKWEDEQPWFVCEDKASRLLSGQLNKDWSYNLTPELKKAIKLNMIELKEIEL